MSGHRYQLAVVAPLCDTYSLDISFRVDFVSSFTSEGFPRLGQVLTAKMDGALWTNKDERGKKEIRRNIGISTATPCFSAKSLFGPRIWHEVPLPNNLLHE